MVRLVPRGLRFRFSLATFLLFSTALTIVVGPWLASARRQRLAVEELESLGARVIYDGELENSIYPTWLTEGLGIDYFLTVKHVSLAGPGGLNRHLFEDWPTDVSPEQRWGECLDRKVAAISQLSHVHEITINYDLWDDDLKRFAPLSDQITNLHIGFYNQAFSGAGLQHLADWPQLNTLELNLFYLGEDAFESLGTIDALEHLSLMVNRPVTVSGPNRVRSGILFAALSKLPRLRELELRSGGFEARELAPLANAPKLQKITLVGCSRFFKYTGTRDPEEHPLETLDVADMQFLLGLVGGYQSYAQSEELLEEMDKRFERWLEEQLPKVEFVEDNSGRVLY